MGRKDFTCITVRRILYHKWKKHKKPDESMSEFLDRAVSLLVRHEKEPKGGGLPEIDIPFYVRAEFEKLWKRMSIDEITNILKMHYGLSTDEALLVTIRLMAEFTSKELRKRK